MRLTSIRKGVVWISFFLTGTAFADTKPNPSSLVPGTTFEDEYIINTVQIEVNADIKTVYDYIVLPDTPGQMLRKRWPVPGVASYQIIEGPWDHPGAYRIVQFTDESHGREEIKVLDSPNYFSYQLSEISGFFGNFVEHINGEWFFEPHGNSTLVTWRYAFKHSGGFSKAMTCLTAKDFMMPFMKDGMARMKNIIEARNN